MTTTLCSGSIGQYLDSLCAMGMSPHTVRAYSSDLRAMASWLDLHPDAQATTETRIATYLTTHRSSWSANTTNRKLTAVRSWARFQGEPTFLENYRAPKAADQEPHPIREGIPGIDRMLEIPVTPSKKALVALCGLCGLRVSEACAVRPEDIDIDRLLLRVRGKGDKTRYVPISRKAWMHIMPAVLDASIAGAVGRSTLVGTGERSARASITSIARRAKLRRRVASHDLRATFATAALDATKDLLAVQQLLGHADPATTQIYTSVSEARRRDAVEAL